MTFVIPLAVPPQLAETAGFVMSNDFTQAHLALRFARDGRAYVQSELDYNYYRYNRSDSRNWRGFVITSISPTWSVEKQTVDTETLRELSHDGDNYVFSNDLTPFAITRHDEVVYTGTGDRTIITDLAGERLATLLTPDQRGASDVIAFDDDTYLVVRARELLAHAGPGTLRDSLADLHGFGSIADLMQRVEFTEYRKYVGPVHALDRDRICVTMFAARGRAGWLDKSAFRYIIVDGAANVVATLPLGAADTPYGKIAHEDVVAHRRLGAWITRSDAAMHVFDRDGARIHRLPLGPDERYESLAAFAPFGAAPDGALVLVNRKHHTLLVTDPIDSVEQLPSALAAAGELYEGEYRRLKKAVPWQSGRFLGYEAVTPVATGAPVKKKKKSGKPEVELAAPVVETVPTDPEQALGNAPTDVATIEVYADWLSGKGDPLGEYVALGCRLEREPNAPGNRDLRTRADRLWESQRAVWLRRWNEPVKLFDAKQLDHAGWKFCHLPYHVKLDDAPEDLEAFDRQLQRMPISALYIEDMSASTMKKLTGLNALSRVPKLGVRGDSRHKLGSTTVRWLAALPLQRTKQLGLSRVTGSAAEFADLLERMTSLVELSLVDCSLTAEAVKTIAATATATRLEMLSLGFNPLGSAVTTALGAFRSVSSLELGKTDIGDDLEAPRPMPAVRKLAIGENTRLGRVGLTRLLGQMPNVVSIAVKDVMLDAVDALLPIAERLEVLDAFIANVVLRQLLVEHVLPRTRVLKELNLIGYGSTKRPQIITALHGLEILHTGDLDSLDELNAYAKAPNLASLKELHIEYEELEVATKLLRASPHLANTRVWVNHQLI